ncbi:ThiF family adenylyltransferase [Nocardioides lacusdianchii]|uniref:ThiF family adenylyltransferase n=1 Tax=Nocardioides lacusdianchii TaxID=2783664 RepID=UPI001CCBB814|nr:ThiF family adenylyltransferase [Nocardioides lacusdianchii]
MWFRDRPDLLQRELDALEEADIPFVLDEEQRDDRGIICLTAEVPIDGVTRGFTATYPDNFPYFKPFVTGPDLGYRHHVSPTTGEYCLLETGRGAWEPSHTLAWLLTVQLNKVVEANQADVGSAGPELEVQQAEPFSAYLRPDDLEEMVVVDSSLVPGDARFGTADLAYTRGAYGTPLRGHVYALRDAGGRDVSTPVDPPMRDAEANRLGEVRIAWAQLDHQPPADDPNSWWAAAGGVFPGMEDLLQGVPGRPRNTQASALQILLVGFPEESAHRRTGQGWVVLVRHRDRARKPWRRPRFVRVERAGHYDLYTREPRLTSMQHARIALVGLGGLGAQLVSLLGCMAPAKMYLIDGDYMNAATAIRNAGAFATTGRAKAALAAQTVHATQPYTELAGLVRQVGMPRLSRDRAQQQHEDAELSMTEIVRDVDLVIDAAADLSVQHFLSDTASANGVAYLRAEALPGVRSGVVALQRPDGGVCWMCWQNHLSTTIAPLPAHEPPGGVQPPGCPDPTYTGAGFDLAAIAAQTAQVAASFLTGPDGYGTLPADVFTVRFVDDSGNPTPASWHAHALDRHPDCNNDLAHRSTS